MPIVRHTPGLYAKRRHPYYIAAPGYDRRSSGIRVMHQLCDSLNQLGLEAYIHTPLRSPRLNAPLLTPEIRAEHKDAGLNPIAIYPEIVGSNPLDCDVVVRYILNRPGLLGEKPNYGNDDLYWLHNAEVADALPHHEGVLHMPAVDTSIFNNLDNPHDQARQGACIYYGRYTEGAQAHPELAARCTVITKTFPTSHEELAALFRRSTHVYCFENTSISMEARLCGCPVVQLPSPFADLTKPFADSLGLSDALIASDDEHALAEARALLPGLTGKYKRIEQTYWDELERLVEKTQAVATSRPRSEKALPKDETDDRNYAIWRSRQTVQEIDAQVLAERMVLKWSQRPGFHLLMALQAGEESLLADTLDSLSPQLYPEWLLTVVTTLPTPDAVADIPNLQWLSLRDEAHIGFVIDEMAAASPGTWLARIEPGLTLEPHALQVIADYVNVRPGWSLIYTDEDTREPDDSYTQPLFKPDFNLDLLRAQSYFGSLVLVAKDAFLASGRYGARAGAENYDLALRILDQVGEGAIGHISQVLAHLPRESRRGLQPEAEKAALGDHLARNGLTAEVLDGALFGTRRVKYTWPDSPHVTIIIPTRDREEYLRPLIESLEERTSYPNCDILILDNDSSDPDTVNYLAALPLQSGRYPIRVIPSPGEFQWSRTANTGAAAATGDYLLFLDNDIHIVQEDWLDRLMALAQRPEIGITSPRLTFPGSGKVQDTGTLLGLRGTAGSAWNNDAEIDDPGYMGRALCDQNLSAANGSAMLVRRSVFEALKGFDAERFPLVHGALDLCLRAGDLGFKTVWTPYSTLVHYGAVSFLARQRKLEGRLADLQTGLNANEALLERWMPRLASDPAYNRNLSLALPYKPDHISPIDWDVNFHDRPRILAAPVPGGAGEYRLRAPLRMIGQAGLAHTMISEPPKAFTMRILTPVEIARAEPDVLILHQPLDDGQSDALETYARHFPDMRRVLTMDDLVTDLPKKHPMYRNGYKDGRQRLRRNLSFMDRLVVSTQPLADLCAGMIDDIMVRPNCLEWSLWGQVAPVRQLARSKPRVGWAGAQQHNGDLELIYPVVEALADEVDWIFMGMCPDPLKPFVKEAHDFELDFRAYPKALARLDLDLAIAPLEIHPFNEAKSNLRLLEYGAMGWPVICTDIYPYRDAPVTRIPNDPDTWIRTIREQLAEPEALRRAGLTLRQWVRDGYILENHTASWFAAYGP